MKILAVNNYVVVQMLPAPKEDFGGLKLPDSMEKNPRWGTVLAAGPGVPDLTGEIVPLDVSEGEMVYIAAHGKERLPTETLADNPKIDMDIIQADLHCASVLDVLGKMVGEDFVPLGAYIVIDKVEPPKEKGGLKYADSQTPTPNFGRVKRLGMGWKTVDGREIPFQVEVGDLIAYLPFQTMIVDLSSLGRDEELYLVQHGNIIGKFPETE